MKLLIAGSRNFNDFELLEKEVNSFLQNKVIDTIISGTAQGADRLGERYAKKYKLKIKKYPADWNRYGKSAGYIRNAEMVTIADYAICFWDGVSKGTNHTINLAAKKNVPCQIVSFN